VAPDATAEMLAEGDRAFLDSKGYEFIVEPEGGMVCVVIKDWPAPAGYRPETVDLLLRLPPGFPDAAPDMYWCDPPLSKADGSNPPASDVRESYLGRTWQRFSRHLPQGAWRPGVDNLQSYLGMIRAELERTA